jgi:site-specific DNA-methyltransferase (adenine-specific)
LFIDRCFHIPAAPLILPEKQKPRHFSSSGRINHDSTRFYSSTLYQSDAAEKPGPDMEHAIPQSQLNTLICKSSEKMDEIPDNSIHLMITSPPYNVLKAYDTDLSLKSYLDLLNTVWKETFRVLVPGGRACINIANIGRKPYIPLHAHVIEGMNKAGFLMRGELIWNKAESSGPSCAWGSWMSASNPVLRDVHEYILVFSKHAYARARTHKETTIKKQEFLDWTRSIWTFPAVPAKRKGHPTPFPEELPNRLIQLYTFKGDVVLDPFTGSGTTCIAAIKAQRFYIGYEIHHEYIQLAEKRIDSCSRLLNHDRTLPVPDGGKS